MPADAAVTVAAIADGYVEERCALVPIEVSYLGVAGHDHELGERVARAVMEERLGQGLERHEAGLPYGESNVLGSAPDAARVSFDLMSSRTEEERGRLRARMEAVPAALAGLADTYCEGGRRGVLPGRRQVLGVAGQCRRWAGELDDAAYGELARDDARRRQNGSFDLRAFHAAAVDLGSMGLDLLRLELARLG